MILLLFALYFSVTEVRAWRREGRARWARPVAWARWLLVALTATTAFVRLAQLGAADLQWTRFVALRPRRFTSFDQVAQLSASARGLAASLLFLILVKVRVDRGGRGVQVGAGSQLMPLAHRRPSSCALYASGQCLERRCTTRCQSWRGWPLAWWCWPQPTHSYLSW